MGNRCDATGAASSRGAHRRRRVGERVILDARLVADVLAELLAITTKNAAAWAKLAARDWTDYVTERGRSMPHRRRS